ncbi:MAG: PEGA domain-containing protein [Archangium sp.]|nr:PEGA domain-containing protein [Archangium sp.]MDP3573248.1 PEGA domain-containing protein [Archangium sp.]
MDLQKPYGVALVLALTLALAPSAALAQKTLWLVRPLYPGQETLVDRTEKALDKLMPGDARKDSVIGHQELAAALKGQTVAEVPCFSADTRCPDPIDVFVAGLGFERIVMIQGGQDEAGFKYRVAAYDPKTGKSNPAVATNSNLEKALLGALAKVVPAASTLDVRSTPAGATVFIDDVKVGVTPLNTQVLPGERVIRFDLKLHQPVEETILIPIRGAASLEKTLDKVAARIVINALPVGTEISIDGAPIGKDKVDRGIAPGEHVIRLSAENHKSFEQTISVKPDQQYSLDKTLESNLPVKDPNGKAAVAGKGEPAQPVTPPPPPKPATIEDQIYERRSYFHVTFETATLNGSRLVGRRFDTEGFGRTTSFITPSRTLVGASAEFGTFGKYFGITVFGLSWLTNIDNWRMNVGYTPGERCEASLGTCFATALDSVKTNLVVIRALQPQVRIALWRFQLALQLGLEFRTGQIIGLDEGMTTTRYKDGFVPLDMLLAGRFNVRFFVVDGMFLQLSANYTKYLIGERSTDDSGTLFSSPDSLGFNGGLGYAF